ncbi:HEPN domain-containing protein [Nocardia sp. NPDC006044]|uniref:HEPN domain-containing protein n=1 Tax=Nocardia sp. NPDC006044 TaxID=3364306 RepID=UPI0036A46AE4
MGRSLLAYLELKNTIDEISSTFMRPQKASPDDADLRSGDAYLVMAHAAFEYFFEELCRRSLYSALYRYKFSGRSVSLLANVANAHFYSRVASLPRDDSSAWSPGETERISAAVKWYTARVDKNNGVKKSNLRALLYPLGFVESDFDSVWMNAMDSFGQSRGDTAHGRPTSPYHRSSVSLGSKVSCAIWTPGVTRPRTATAVWDVSREVKQLMPEMLAWDRRLVALCRK